MTEVEIAIDLRTQMHGGGKHVAERTLNSLHRHGFIWIEDLAELTEMDLFDLRGFGRKQVEFLKYVLSPYGLKFAKRKRNRIKQASSSK